MPQVSAPANHCSNPVSSFTLPMIDYFGVRSCSQIVCMSCFMFVVLCFLACLSVPSVPDSERASTSVSGSSKMDSDDILVTHTRTHTYTHPEVTVGAQCITVIEADNAPTGSVLCPI